MVSDKLTHDSCSVTKNFVQQRSECATVIVQEYKANKSHASGVMPTLQILARANYSTRSSTATISLTTVHINIAH